MRESKKSNDVKRVTEEAVADIRYRAEAERASREIAEAEASANVEADTKEKTERMRKVREAKANAEVDTVERAWDESK